MGFMTKKKSSVMDQDGNGIDMRDMRDKEPDADDMPNTNRMGRDNDADDRGGFMSKPKAKKKSSFMRGM